MPLPESFDINSFDSADLWGLTRALARKLPSLHVFSINRPNYLYPTIASHVGATLHTPVANGRRVEFESTEYRASLEALTALHQLTCQAMGSSARYDDFTQDRAPEKGNAELQLGAARKFLSHIGKVSVIEFTRTEDEEQRPIRCGVLCEVVGGEDRPSRQTIEAHANLNLQLASLAGEATAPYEEIVTHAATWDPIRSLPPSLSWLAPRAIS